MGVRRDQTSRAREVELGRGGWGGFRSSADVTLREPARLDERGARPLRPMEVYGPASGPAVQPLTVIPWRNCYASNTLVAEINALNPNRDKTSDGTIGDAAHATRTSDHNPWVVKNGIGIVRARDIDKDGTDIATIFEDLRKKGQQRDSRLWPNGYLIYNRRITNPDFGGWHEYTGSNPHTAHGHISFSTDPVGFDRTDPWGISVVTGAELDANERRLLQETHDFAAWCYYQMGFPGEANPGWKTWPGGTNEALSLVDYNRRANVMLVQMSIQIEALKQMFAQGGVDTQALAASIVATIREELVNSIGDVQAEALVNKIIGKIKEIPT